MPDAPSALAPAPEVGGARRARLLSSLGLVLLLGLLYVGPLLLGRTFAGRDHLLWVLPSRTYHAQRLAAGEIPEWWSAIGPGVPFGAHPGQGVAYPPTWILAAVPGPLGADLLLLGHLLLGALGIAWLSRQLGATPLGELLGGATFLASGYATSMITNGIPLLTLAWTPWVGLAAVRLAGAATAGARAGPALGLSALLGLQVLSGDPAGLLASGLVTAALLGAVGRPALRALPWLGAAVLGALVLAAVGLLPALSLLGTSERGGGLALPEATVWSHHPLRLLEWVWPEVLGDPGRPGRHLAWLLADTGGSSMGPSWSPSVFLGLPVLLVAAAAGHERRLRVLAVAAALLVLLALGRYTPVYAAFRAVFLPERLIRYPEKHLAGALVLITALAALGASRLLDGAFHRRAARGATVAAAVLGGLVLTVGALRDPLVRGLAGAAARQRLALDPGAAWSHAMVTGGAAVAGAVLFAVALWLPGLRRLPGLQRRGALLGGAALLLPLVLSAVSIQPQVRRSDLAGPPALTRGFQGRLYRDRHLPLAVVSDDPVTHALALHATAAPDVGAGQGLVHLPGYDPVLPGRFRRFWEAGVNQGFQMLRLLGVEAAVFPPGAAPPGAGAASGPPLLGLGVFRVPGTRPRAFWTGRAAGVASFDAVLAERFVTPELDRVLLEGSGIRASTPRAPVPCQVTERRPEDVRVRCHSPAPGHLVLLDGHAPGWSARVNGRAAPILRADGIFRAVAVPAGPVDVRFTYRTPGLRTGALVSLLGWLLVVVAALGLRLRRDH